MSENKQDPRVQGEGDYRAARRYRRDVEEFVGRNDIEKLARKAGPRSEAEHHQMLEAERKGRARAKGRKPGNSPSER